MDSREQFEKWYWDNFGQFEDVRQSECFKIEEGDYYRLGTRMTWFAWQASRATIEIQQPHFITSHEAVARGYMVEYSNGFGDGMDAYEANIKAQGLTIREE